MFGSVLLEMIINGQIKRRMKTFADTPTTLEILDRLSFAVCC